MGVFFFSSFFQEANLYIENLGKRFGSFRFAEMKTIFNATFLDHYLALLIPGVTEYRAKKRISSATDDVQCDSFTSSRSEQCMEISSTDIDVHHDDKKCQSSSNCSNISLNVCSNVYNCDVGNFDGMTNDIDHIHHNGNNVEISPKISRLYDGDIIVID